MMRQDNAKGKGMHQRRLLIVGALDALSAANLPGGRHEAFPSASPDLISHQTDLVVRRIERLPKTSASPRRREHARHQK